MSIVADEPGLIVEEPGRDGLFGVFEDDVDTGYLYIYEPGGREVFRHLHVYDRSQKLPVTESDVRVLWSNDFSKCGVAIWGKMRGIVNLVTGQEGRVWLENRDTPGVGEATWLEGFHVSSLRSQAIYFLGQCYRYGRGVSNSPGSNQGNGLARSNTRPLNSCAILQSFGRAASVRFAYARAFRI
jgi:hypothetical protein